MSKKKQLTGKKTKLAKLPLTKVLSQKMDEAEEWEPAPAAVEESNRQLPLSWERLEEGAASLLTAAYLLILQDLVALQAELTVSPGESPETHAIPVHLPPLPHIKQALHLTRTELNELYHFLSYTKLPSNR
jgi:hypothetical protein